MSKEGLPVFKNPTNLEKENYLENGIHLYGKNYKFDKK